MRTLASIAAFAAVSLCSLSASHAAPPPKSAPATITLVFKDGHRQSFSLADVAHIEFSGAAEIATLPPADSAARGQFVGKWIVGVGSTDDGTFAITLNADGSASRSLHPLHGTWQFINGEAQITWDDGAKDAIRKVGSKFQKYSYMSGQPFTGKPDNVTSARNTTPKPI